MNDLKPKLFDVLKDYNKEQLMKDIISGIIVAIIALPLSIALAIASGVGPEQGNYIWDCCPVWNRRAGCSDDFSRNYSGNHGIV